MLRYLRNGCARRIALAGVILFLDRGPADLRAQRLRDFVTPLPVSEGGTLVIGFLGGVERWDDSHRGVRRVALHLRQAGVRPVFAETLVNRRPAQALALIEQALDRNGNGRLDADERRNARIVLYGQSLGGAATVHLAQMLNERAIPVLLTVQVDSVGLGDREIPSNVRAAANFYQRGRLTIKGCSAIRAHDPTRTRILGNFQRSYPQWAHSREDRERASWARLAVGGGHARMETDPALWAEVEELIRSAIAGPANDGPFTVSSR